MPALGAWWHVLPAHSHGRTSNAIQQCRYALLLLVMWPFAATTVLAQSFPPPPSEFCMIKEHTADPVCMAKLNKDARAGTVKSIEDITARVLGCLGFKASDFPPIRALTADLSTPTFSMAQYFQTSAINQVYTLTGVNITVDLTSFKQLPYRILDFAETGKAYYSVWISEGNIFPDLAAQGMLQSLDNYVYSDPNLDWLDIHKFSRSAALYNGSVYGVPLGGRNVLLYYRKDILSASNLSVPATWDDLLYVARTLNGTDYNKDGQPEYAMCLMTAGNMCDAWEAQGFIAQVLTSMTQTKGSSSGWLFDPDTVNSFIDTEAMNRTLWLLSELVKYSWPSAQCDEISPYMWSGRCAITLNTDSTWKEIQTRRQPNPWRGKKKIVAAMLPGSNQVLDRMTGRLVPCTNTTQCPHATYQYSMALNDTVLVNNAPYKYGVGMAIVNSAIPDVYKPAATQVVTLLSAPDMALLRLFTIKGAGAPYRYKQLATDPASLNAWTVFGCNTSDVKDYLEVVTKILEHPNIAPEHRFLNAYLYSPKKADPRNINDVWVNHNAATRLGEWKTLREWLQESAYLLAAGSPPSTVHQYLSRNHQQHMASVNLKQFAESLWAGLNIQRAWQYPPPPPQLDTPASSDSGPTLSAGIIAAIVVPSAAAVLVLAVAAFLAVKRGWVRLGPSGPPKSGPLTTLVVTDVEESTQLWESVPLEAMDETIRLHHGLIRKLLAKHHGYESATEGDAFIMAFHTPGQAMDFSYALQQQLLEQPWPAEILQHNVTKPVWAKGNVQWTLKHQDTIDLNGGLLSGSGKREKESEGPAAQPRLKLWQPKTGAVAGFMSALQILKCQWRVADNTDGLGSEELTLGYRGLRLRLGLHTGVGEEDVVVNKTNGGLQYTGQSLLTAKSVADSGQGGMIVMTLATFEAWKHEWVGPENAKKTDEDDHDAPLVLHLGSFVFKKAPELEAVEVYSAVVRGLECRLAVGSTSLRNAEQVAAGVLQAPVGSASVAFCTMVGYSTLLAWNKTLALDALATFNQKAVESLYEPDENIGKGCEGQYLLELADGLCLAVFGSATAAITWGHELIESLKQVDWPEELLSHGMCEPVAVAMHNNDGDQDGPGGVAMLFNGPRVKVGIDSGDLTCDVSPATGRLAYRGRSMNRAARIVDKCPSGQVWCSEATYLQAVQEPGSACLRGKELGMFAMKGLPQPLLLFHCHLAANDNPAQASGVSISMSTRLPQLLATRGSELGHSLTASATSRREPSLSLVSAHMSLLHSVRRDIGASMLSVSSAHRVAGSERSSLSDARPSQRGSAINMDTPAIHE